MNNINIKTLALTLSASVLLALSGCKSTTGTPSDSQLVGSSNIAPVAVAKANPTTVTIGDTITLDGSGSYDDDGEITSYVWKIQDVVLSKEMTFDAATSDVPAGTYTVTLTVVDNDDLTGTSSVDVTVVNPAVNQPPVADAGSDQNIMVSYTEPAVASTSTASVSVSESSTPQITVTLDGSLSSDDGLIQPLSYLWETIEKEDTIDGYHDFVLSDPTSEHPTFTVSCDNFYSWVSDDCYDQLNDQDAEYVCASEFNLTVDDGQFRSSDTVTIFVEYDACNIPNQEPVANAGSDQTIGICDALIMDGTGSSDEDGSIVSYVWSVGDGAIVLGEGPTATLTLSGRTPGEHDITLTVTDNDGSTSTDIVTVTVTGNDDDYDFSYIVKDPLLQPENPYLSVTPLNAKKYNESSGDKFRYWATTTTGSSSGVAANPGIVNFDFDFPQNIEIAYLKATITTFHFSYSAGTAYLHASKDGTTWEELLYANTPAINGYNMQTQNGFLDDTLIGSNTLSIKADLHADGSTYALTAQYLRTRLTTPDNETFKLNVCFEAEVAE